MNTETISKEKAFFSYDEAYATALKYFEGDELAASTWVKKYAMKDPEGKIVENSPEMMHRRMAKEFARIEKNYPAGEDRSALSDYGQVREELTEDSIYELFEGFKYIVPQGSVMTALGNKEMIASLSNCVVVPSVEDSYGGICHTDEQLVQLFKRRCGVGVDISGLRPKNSVVSNADGTTTGAVSFMERYSNTTREVAQNGRRGALMLTMDVAHPDIEDFIAIKQDLKKVTGANISVRISDEFMQAVDKNTEYTLRWPIDNPDPKYSRVINARELWNKIIASAHNTAEPGIIFWDRQHYYSTSSVYPGYKNVSTNPCSEIAMQGGDSCRLIAINMLSFVNNPFTEEASFDYEKFYRVAYEGQRLNDDLVDLELECVSRILAKVDSDKEPEIIKRNERELWELLYNTGKKGRRTGLGFTGLADTIAALNFKFDSIEALSVVDQIMKTKLRGEFDSSIDMAITRGAFEGFNKKYEDTSDFVKMLKKEFAPIYKRMMKYGRRNISLSTVAPTGTISLLTRTSSGIEPVFMLSYKRRRKVQAGSGEKPDYVDDMGDGFKEFVVYHPGLARWKDVTGEEDIALSPYAGSTAAEIDWYKRVQMQALVQKYTTHSISSTINLPSDVTVDRVGEIYMESWKQGLKGITVYRDGSRSGVLVAADKKDKKEDDKAKTMGDMVMEKDLIRRPKRLEADVIRFQNEYEKWIAVIGIMDGKPYEIFTGRMEDAFNLPSYVEKGVVIKEKDEEGNSRYDFQYTDKDGYRTTIEGLSRSFNKEYWNYAIVISEVLRHGMPLTFVVELINNLRLYDENINTWKNGVLRAFKRYIPNGTAAADKKCPQCGDPNGLIYENGCIICKSCGHSKCG
ncbi:MAG: adenosylcobalamin-dependent ribonucleoside-diphosphate reductase [Flavobacteriales bacterium]|nr:adenosylcobalamin-dependent ribonucleoside-diphosphate reductase [Flavobacteriales bacterium]